MKRIKVWLKLFVLVIVLACLFALPVFADTIVTTTTTPYPYFHTYTNPVASVFYFVGDVIALPFRFVGDFIS